MSTALGTLRPAAVTARGSGAMRTVAILALIGAPKPWGLVSS